MKLCGIEFNESLFKKRKGFRNIVIDGEMFQYNVGRTCIIYYNTDGKKLSVSMTLWKQFSETSLYKGALEWRGKDRSWSKSKVAELYRKYLLTI
jgi:hypothetical protein